MLAQFQFSQAQILNVDSLLTDPWVDSVFNSMTLTERVNQLFILELELDSNFEIDSARGYGGILVHESGPNSYLKNVNSFNINQNVGPLVFQELGDPFGLKLDSIDNFGRAELLHFVQEPYLFYETGVALARQCNALGISALFNRDIALSKIIKNDQWKLTELNQGFVDNKVIPINGIRINEYRNEPTDFLGNLSSWDMILVRPNEFQGVHEKIQEAITQDQIGIVDLEYKCKRVLAYKNWIGVDMIAGTSIIAEQDDLLRNPHNQFLNEEMAKYLLVATGMNADKIPIRQIENKKIVHLSIGDNHMPDFNIYANKYASVDYFEVGYQGSDKEYAGLWTILNSYDIIICTYCNLDQAANTGEEHEGFLLFQDWLIKSGKSISVAFVGEDDITGSCITNKALGDIIVLENNAITNRLVPQLIFGGIEAYGKIDTIKGTRPFLENGADVKSLNRFSYTLPEAVGLNHHTLNKIDSIAIAAIQNKAIPGCQILVAKDRKVVYQKSFGYHTYDSLRKVLNTDLYDLASVTKVSGALPVLMKLYEEGRFDLEATMGTYLPFFKRGNKKELTYREILAHQSGLFPYIVYWQTAIKKNGKYKRKTLSTQESKHYVYELSPGLYLHKDYKKKIYRQIRKSKLGEKKYKYSGLTFLLYPEIIERITGQNYENYLHENFYAPLGATSITYNPLNKFELETIVPTEYDSLFRKRQVHGKVHDEAAAMMEGVSSNAGLFANANDLAKLFQMYCNYGTYGSREYLKEETLMEFSRCQYPENDNRRGLGFDRPLPEPHEKGNTAKSVSQLSFGHSGFTGTFAWVDPEYNIVYIFLSNRVYKTRINPVWSKMNVRTDIQEVIYKAMEHKE